MGFFDLFRKKKQEPIEIVEKEINVPELLKEVKGLEKDKFGDFYEKFSNYDKKIVSLSKDLEKQLVPA